jgi:hypothetical protein
VIAHKKSIVFDLQAWYLADRISSGHHPICKTQIIVHIIWMIDPLKNPFGIKLTLFGKRKIVPLGKMWHFGCGQKRIYCSGEGITGDFKLFYQKLYLSI